jgi:hypothetical protein
MTGKEKIKQMEIPYIIVRYIHSGMSDGVKMNDGYDNNSEFMGIIFLNYY